MPKSTSISIEEHEAEESYFVSMTDIMVGLLFIFIIIIMYFSMQINNEPVVSQSIHNEVLAERDFLQSELDKLEDKYNEQITRIEELQSENEKLKERDRRRVNEFDTAERLKTRIKNLIDKNLALRVNVRELKVEVVRILEKLEFSPREKQIDDPQTSLVDEVATLVRLLKGLKVDAFKQYVNEADNRLEQILKDMQELMSEAGFKVEIVPEQGILRLSNNLLFPNAVSDIVPGTPAYEAATNLAKSLKTVLPCFTRGEISAPNRSRNCNPSAAFIEAVFIEGHTDNVPVLVEIEPGVKNNLDLSAKRATNTYRRLVEAEPDLIKLQSVGKKPVLNIAAFGETRPIADNETKQGKDKNRRIDVRILMYTPRSEHISNIQKLVPIQ